MTRKYLASKQQRADLARGWPKMAKNGPNAPRNGSNWPEMADWPQMAQNGPRRSGIAQNGRNWTRNYQKAPAAEANGRNSNEIELGT